ncbi:hypothetical protein HSX11_06570 [Oxalobacteraceae bacterium]|nr:hypothetical protein [Oxalobacteraceae bacterium]
MAKILQEIFVDPPMAIARLGASRIPLDAFVWSEAAGPRGSDDTTLMPRWTLDVQPDGTVQPRMPKRLTFRDGEHIRPLCPFFELWAKVGEAGSDRSTWQAVPLTPALLKEFGGAPSDLVLHFNAVNSKAARRRNDPDLRFGTFPPVSLRGDQHAALAISGSSPPDAARPLLQDGRSIPLGSLRFLRSKPQPAPQATPWTDDVNVEVMRFRFTPPAGRFYGPPAAAQARTHAGRSLVAVPAECAFLNGEVGWLEQPVPPQSGDAAMLLDVVDDTSDARISVELSLPGRPVLRTRATLFVAPPDFALSQRPAPTIGEDLRERKAAAHELADALTAPFEAVSLMTAEHWRAVHAQDQAPEDSAQLTINSNAVRADLPVKQ